MGDATVPVKYKHLSQEQRDHFLEHGWVKFENALAREPMEYLLKNFWDRLGPGAKEDDPSTWPPYEDVAMPRHKEVLNEVLMPEVWPKICELVGGEDRLHPVRERYQGDQFIFNSGGADLDPNNRLPPHQLTRWHTDNDWYTQTLDASGNALTLIVCFSDIVEDGGGTWIAEDGIEGVVRYLHDRPQGIKWPFKGETLYGHVKDCKKFVQVVAKKGDVFALHSLLPHTVGKNYVRRPRIITNPHVGLKDPYNFNREDPADYSLVEQVILRALGVKSLPNYQSRAMGPDDKWYPRNYQCKGSRIPIELAQIVKATYERGGNMSDIDSIHWRRNEKEVRDYMERSGLNLPYGPDPWLEDTRPKGRYYEYQLEHLLEGHGTKHSPDGRACPQ